MAQQLLLRCKEVAQGRRRDSLAAVGRPPPRSTRQQWRSRRRPWQQQQSPTRRQRRPRQSSGSRGEQRAQGARHWVRLVMLRTWCRTWQSEGPGERCSFCTTEPGRRRLLPPGKCGAQSATGRGRRSKLESSLEATPESMRVRAPMHPPTPRHLETHEHARTPTEHACTGVPHVVQNLAPG